MAKSIFAGAVEPESEGWLRCTLASIGEAVLDLVLSQAMKPQAIASTRISVEPRMDACYSSPSGYGNGGMPSRHDDEGGSSFSNNRRWGLV